MIVNQIKQLQDIALWDSLTIYSSGWYIEGVSDMVRKSLSVILICEEYNSAK